MSIQDLLNYETASKANQVNNATVTYDSVSYYVSDLANNVTLTNAYIDAQVQNPSGQRGILFPANTNPEYISNSALITLLQSAYAVYYEMNDIHYNIVQQILATTITTTAQIDSAWVSALASYTTNRVYQPSLYFLSGSVTTNTSNIASLTSSVSANSASITSLNSSVATNTSNISSLTSTVNGMNPSASWHTNTRSIVTNASAANGFQVSSSNPFDGVYYINLSCTSTIATASTATVILEVAPTNSSNPSDYVEYGRVSTGQTYSLAVVLQGVQTMTAPIYATGVPAGYYTRLRGVYTGTASATVQLSRERY